MSIKVDVYTFSAYTYRNIIFSRKQHVVKMYMAHSKAKIMLFACGVTPVSRI